MDHIKIAHIDTSKTWRGGQRQAAFLHKYMHEHIHSSLMVCQPDSAMKDYCKKNNLPYVVLNMRGELDIRAALRLLKIIQKYGLTIVHAHTAHALSLGLISKFFYPAFSLIYTKRVAYPIRKNVFSLCKYRNHFLNKIICISNYIKDSLISQGIPADKLLTIPSGIVFPNDAIINTNAFKRKHHIPEDSFIIITIAALEKNKGYDVLIEAAQSIIGRNKSIYFIALGKGKHEDELKQKVVAKAIHDNFLFLGFQEDVASFLKVSDIFVLPSKKEGLGSSILDAQAMGVPVIATHTGGIPELIENDNNGILIPVDDRKALEEAIMRLYDNHTLRKKLANNAQQSVRAFSIDNTAEKNITLYKELQ